MPERTPSDSLLRSTLPNSLKGDSIAQPETEWVQRAWTVVRQIRPLRKYRLHRRGQLERQFSLGMRTTRQHIDQRFVAHTEVRDDRARALLDRCENRRPIEVDDRDRRHHRADALECLVIGIAVAECETPFVEERTEGIPRV